jgi:hypothetical protein
MGITPPPLLLPKFSPSQEIAFLFIVKFRAPRTVDPVRWSARDALTAEAGLFAEARFPRSEPGQIGCKPSCSVAFDYAGQSNVLKQLAYPAGFEPERNLRGNLRFFGLPCFQKRFFPDSLRQMGQGKTVCIEGYEVFPPLLKLHRCSAVCLPQKALDRQLQSRKTLGNLAAPQCEALNNATKVDCGETEDMDLTQEDIAVLLNSLNYSIERVSNAQDTPYNVRQENLQRLQAVQEKLRKIKTGWSGE